MIDYSKLIDQIFTDTAVIKGNSLIDRKLLTDRFIIPLIDISSHHIPEDANAIEVNNIANDVHLAYTNLEHVTLTHTNAIKSHLKVLENAKEQIASYLG